MEKRKIEALRDLAIAHFPKASKQRADAIKYRGSMWADSGLMSALMFEDYAATAVEKQARELLQLTFMHPDARPFQPLDWDGAEADEARMVEQVREVQPQLEASMLDAARLLCELAGGALPKWVDAAAAPKVEAGAGTSPSIEVWKANARLIGERIHKEKPKLNAEKIAEKTHDEMTTRKANGEPGMTGRGGNVPSAGTIKRHAQTGITA